jgi:anti-anti-sigma factor
MEITGGLLMSSELYHSLEKEEAANELTVVHFTGARVALDEETLQGIRDQLLALADEPGQSELVLDFSNVQSISSMALGTLIRLRKKLLASGRGLAIRNLSPLVHEVFAVTRLDGILDARPAENAEPTSERRARLPSGVLVVDDELAVRSLVETGLRNRGIQVWAAAGGPQAVALYRRHPGAITLVLLDVIMTGMDGPQTLAALQKVRPTVRCCFMTSSPARYSAEALSQMGAVRVFQKPFALAELIEALHELACWSSRTRLDRWIEVPPERGEASSVTTTA